jgi:uncharacterized protein involved in cysteine biosynthesis
MDSLTPLRRAVAQLDDPVFLGVLGRSLAWSLLCFVLLLAGGFWGTQTLVALPYWRWLGGVAGLIGAALLAFWLFLPLAAVIATLYLNHVAAAVEHRFYPGLPDPGGAAFAAQLGDGLGLGLRILLLNSLAFIVAAILPGIGLPLGLAISAWALGRGLFMTVAMRRLPRAAALACYRRQRLVVLAYGGILAFSGWLPILNLVSPVLGTAVMVHVFHQQFPERFLFAGGVVSRKRLL